MANIPIEEFLRPFFDSGEIVNLRVFDDRKAGTFKGTKLQCEAGKICTVIKTLQEHNAQNRGIFFVVNYGGDTDAEISRINAVFVENDKISIDEQIRKLNEFTLPPSLMVKTAKSVHAYWLVKDVGVPEFRTYQRRLISQFDGDPACVNESRVLRLPGFNHCKGEPVMVECIKFNPELRYTKTQLDAALPRVADEVSDTTPPPSPKSKRKGLTLVGERCDFMKYCRENAAALPENLWYAMITNLAVFEDGERIIHTLSKDYPKYSISETNNKINHFLNSGTKPMTCAKIAELGFKCPKLENGDCGCKSPAALAYKALTADELLVVLGGLERRDNVLDNIKTIQAFISDYLYNVAPVIAETLINHDVKERFSLRQADLKPLLALHRDAYKRYSSSKETRRETSDVELPDWYEVTERGALRFLPGILSEHMAKTIPAFYGAGCYYFYEQGVYEMCEDLSAWATVQSYLMPRQARSNDISDAEKQWRARIIKPIREINANPFIINVRNGLYNVLEGSFREHTSDYYSTVQINANYAPDAECPQFLEFLSGILPDSELPLVQEIFGYLLIPVNKAQKSFVFVGAPNAGKSTLLSIAQEVLLGSENVSNIPWQALGDRFNKAELFGKLANIFADLPSKAIDDGGMFKSLTGEDYITAERKNKDPFNFRPYARLLFSCNDIPKNYSDRSDAFYRRLIIIRFDQSVPQEKRDPNLRERIATERDGILMWALTGLKRLITNNYQFGETERTRKELWRYRVESNSALMFLEECCEIKDGAECIREHLFELYGEYCRKNGFKTMSQINFNRDVENADPLIKRAVDKLGKRRTWRGLKPHD